MRRRSFLQALAAVPFASAIARPVLGIRRRTEVSFPVAYPKTWRTVHDGHITMAPQCTLEEYFPGTCLTSNTMVLAKGDHAGVHAQLTGNFTLQLINPHPFPVRVEYEVREYR